MKNHNMGIKMTDDDSRKMKLVKKGTLFCLIWRPWLIKTGKHNKQYNLTY